MLTVSVPDDAGRELLGVPLDDVEVLVWDGLDDAPPDGVERIRLFVGRYDLTAVPAPRAFARMPRLETVQLLSAGFEPWVGVLPARVTLCNARGVHGGSTAELAVAGLLAILRDLPAFWRAQDEHDWDRRPTRSIAGSRVLVVGAGDIGERVAAVARTLDAEVTLVARTARDDVRAMSELPSLLPQHDVVVLAAPLTPDTRGLVDAGFLAALPDDAVVVNIARGGVIDTDALLAELTARRLHAFLDVTDPEPLPAAHPLWSAPNLLLTPHIGGGVHGWQRRAYRLVREQVVRARAGEPLVNQISRSG